MGREEEREAAGDGESHQRELHTVVRHRRRISGLAHGGAHTMYHVGFQPRRREAEETLAHLEREAETGRRLMSQFLINVGSLPESVKPVYLKARHSFTITQ